MEVQARHFQIVLDIGMLAFYSTMTSHSPGERKPRYIGLNMRYSGLILSFIGTRFAGYMQRLKKMDRERLAEAIGTRLDVSANTLRSPEIPVVARTSKKRNSDNGLEQTKNESDLDYD